MQALFPVMRAWWLVMLVACRFNFGERDMVATDASDAPTTRDGPVPTCTGHDEDGDGYPDACDVCPANADPTQADSEGDGVGDMCDPRPGTNGDYILAFDPHTTPSATYINPGGTVQWPGEVLRVGTDASFGSVTFILAAVPTALEIRARVISTDNSVMASWFGVWYSASPAFSEMVFATGNHNPGGSNGSFYLKQDTTGTDSFSPALVGPAQFDGQRYTLTVHTSAATGGDDLLYVTDGSGTRMSPLAITIPRTGRGLLEVNKATVDIEYFIAYGAN